jgi:hypothetical protein
MKTRFTNNGVRQTLLLLGMTLSLFLIAACDRATTTATTTPDAAVTFGKVVTAANVDANNAPTALADTFSPSQKTIYVVAEAKQVAPGTRLAASWTRDGTPVEVSNEVVAQQGYRNTNIEFHLNAGTDGFAPGSYKVELLVNGKPGPSARYIVK